SSAAPAARKLLRLVFMLCVSFEISSYDCVVTAPRFFSMASSSRHDGRERASIGSVVPDLSSACVHIDLRVDLHKQIPGFFGDLVGRHGFGGRTKTVFHQ